VRVESPIGRGKQGDKCQVVAVPRAQRLTTGPVTTSSPLAQEQFWRHSIFGATVVHSRHIRPCVAMLEVQGNVVGWLQAAQLACANQFSRDGVALQQASTKAADEVTEAVVSSAICCHPPLLHCQACVGEDMGIRLRLCRAKPMMHCSVEVEKARRMVWFVKATSSTWRNKRCDVVALVVYNTCSAGEASIGNDGFKSGREARQRDLHLHSKATAARHC
jgi:hypothetical protein